MTYRPVRPIERPAIAPISLSISIALLVPTACAAEPRLTPIATLSSTFSILYKLGPNVAPVIPVTITNITVIGIIPWTFSAKPTAMAVVTDFGINEAIISGLYANNLQTYPTTIQLIVFPTIIPVSIETKCFFNKCKFLCNGIARATVAGVINVVNIEPLCCMYHKVF